MLHTIGSILNDKNLIKEILWKRPVNSAVIFNRLIGSSCSISTQIQSAEELALKTKTAKESCFAQMTPN